MPELPEVETVCRGLRPHVVGNRILRYHQFRENLRWQIPLGIKDKLEGSIIEELNRRGKFLLFKLNTGNILIMHLGMSGRILISDTSKKKKDLKKPKEMGVFFHTVKPTGPHDHVIIDFSDQKRMIYNDVRRFGAIDIFKSEIISSHQWLSKLGPEPLTNHFSSEVLKSSIKNKKSYIKTALMDQKLLAGLGNIYACEILWESRISPFRLCLKIDDSECELLANSIREILWKAIEAGGSSLRDFKKVGGDLGYFQNSFSVYSREGLKCKRNECGSNIQRVNQSGRSTFFCSKCQQ